MKPLAIITGGTSGIGLALAKSLAPDYSLLLVYRDRHENAQTALTSLGSHPGSRVEILSIDLSRPDGPATAYERARSLGLPIRVLVNAAGHSIQRLFLQTSALEMDEIILTHLLGTMKLTRLAAEDMCRAGYGRLICFSSVAVRFKRGLVAYSTAKAGVEQFAESLATELFRYGVTVNAVRPGLVTETGLEPGSVAMAAVVQAVLKLLSPEAEAVNGSVIEVNDPSH